MPYYKKKKFIRKYKSGKAHYKLMRTIDREIKRKEGDVSFVEVNISNVAVTTETEFDYEALGQISPAIITAVTGDSVSLGVGQRTGNKIEVLGFDVEGTLISNNTSFPNPRYAFMRLAVCQHDSPVSVKWDSATSMTLREVSSVTAMTCPTTKLLDPSLIKCHMDRKVSVGYSPDQKYVHFRKWLKKPIPITYRFALSGNFSGTSSIVPNNYLYLRTLFVTNNTYPCTFNDGIFRVYYRTF